MEREGERRQQQQNDLMEQLITLNQVQTQSVYPPTTLKKLFHLPPSQTNTDLMADRIKGVLRMEATFKRVHI